MSHVSSPFGEVRIQITSPVEDGPEAGQSFTTPAAPGVSFADAIADDKLHVTFEKEEKDKKKSRKSVDDAKSKRKDTATSFTNFFHRLTRFDKEEKQKSVTSIVEEDQLLDRPSQLILPDAGDENWTELKTLGTDQFRTALDMGNETGKPTYEWKPDDLLEHLLIEAVPQANNLISIDFDRSEKDDFERSLVCMLEEFRSGNMRSFSDEQIAAMRAAKQDHEEVTNMHIALYSLDSDASDNDIESRLEAICDSLSYKMTNMHNRLASLVPPQHN